MKFKFLKREGMKERLQSFLFLLPSLLGVLVFFVIPFLIVIYYSVIDDPINQNFVGLYNFKHVLSNKAFGIAAKNTLIFSLLSVPGVVIVSLLMALLLEKNIPYKSTFRTFFLSPLMVPVASIVLIWRVLFDNNGSINELMKAFGGQPLDWFQTSFSQVVIMILFLWKNLGYNMILFMSALNSIPQDVIEVFQMEYAGNFTLFRKIKLRYLSSTIFFVSLLSLVNSFKVFREIYLLTGDYPFSSLYMLQHFMNNTFRSLDYQKLSAAAIIMALVMVVIIGIMFFIEDYIAKDIEG
ncbi:MAG: sugar ABC transporter permease [Lachnospiraceae bacterium]|nr:sugar ABC transporter permease [Lachnospiraceae bacterium]